MLCHEDLPYTGMLYRGDFIYGLYWLLPCYIADLPFRVVTVTTVTSTRIPEEDASHRAHNLMCFLMRAKRNTEIDE